MAPYRSSIPTDSDLSEIARLEKGISILSDCPAVPLSIALAKSISALILNVNPLYHGWADQTYRACISAVCGIWEGSLRNSIPQRLQYLNIGYASAGECLGCLLAAPETVEVGRLVDDCREVCRLLGVMVLDHQKAKCGLDLPAGSKEGEIYFREKSK